MSPPRPYMRQSPMNASQHSLALSANNKRLSIIAEDGDAAPPVPQRPHRVHHRPYNSRWNIGDPPRHSFENSPPAYSVWSLTKPKSEKLRDVKNNKFIVGRGGWRRILALTLLVIATIVALVVGLVVGLRRRHSSKSETSSILPSPNSTSPMNAPFPVGSYAVTTFLDTVATNCTSNPATWLCFPYTTYSSSHSGALATFNWIISPSNASNSTYMISSSDNPFTVDFANATLSLNDAGTSQERYTFSIPLQKIVVPTTAITTDNAAASCYYNNTQFQASLYTRMPSSYNATQNPPTTGVTPSSTSTTDGFQAWPFAAEVAQTSEGGADVPACYEGVNGNNGNRITNGLEPQSSTDMCTCEYKNFDP